MSIDDLDRDFASKYRWWMLILYFDKNVIELQVTRLTKDFVQSKMAYLINIDNFSKFIQTYIIRQVTGICEEININ